MRFKSPPIKKCPFTSSQEVAPTLNHIGFTDQSAKLNKAIDICSQYEKKLTLTGRDTGCTGEEMAQYIIETIKSPDLDQKWQSYQ